MSDLFERVTGDQDFIKKIASYIPGFKGYIERTNRRAADKMLRDKVALHYEELWSRASNMQKDISDAGQIDFLIGANLVIMAHGLLRWFCFRRQKYTEEDRRPLRPTAE